MAWRPTRTRREILISTQVDTNNGADVTSISSIKINGKTRESTNMANFKKVG